MVILILKSVKVGSWSCSLQCCPTYVELRVDITRPLDKTNPIPSRLFAIGWLNVILRRFSNVKTSLNLDLSY